MEKYKYRQLVERIRQAIDAGEYPVGQPLPGERELAEKHRYSRQTVRKAIGILCDEKVLKQVHGSGNYVLKKPSRPQSGLVAVIATHIALPNFANTLYSMEKTLVDGGYYPIISTTSNRFDFERRAVEDLLQKNVDGLIVEGALSTIPNPNMGLYKDIVRQGIPLVFINSHYNEIENAVCLSMDNTQGGELCGRYLAANRHTRVAGVFKADDQGSMARYGGLARYLNEHGFPLDDSNLLWYTSGNLQRPLEEFALACLEKCTAVVCFNDEVAFELCGILHRNGVSIPDDFTFVAFDKTEFSRRIPHRIITLKYRQEDIGKLAAQKLMNMMQGNPEASSYLQWQLFDAADNIVHLREGP